MKMPYQSLGGGSGISLWKPRGAQHKKGREPHYKTLLIPHAWQKPDLAPFPWITTVHSNGTEVLQIQSPFRYTGLWLFGASQHYSARSWHTRLQFVTLLQVLEARAQWCVVYRISPAHQNQSVFQAWLELCLAEAERPYYRILLFSPWIRRALCSYFHRCVALCSFSFADARLELLNFALQIMQWGRGVPSCSFMHVNQYCTNPSDHFLFLFDIVGMKELKIKTK